jgi:hypothetical protein
MGKRWTPEGVASLRRLDGTVTDYALAKLLGRSCYSIVNKKKELRYAENSHGEITPVQRYARLYAVSHTVVEMVGVKNLDLMDEEHRRKTLWKMSKRFSSNSKKDETAARIERMMQLSERCG